jgi:hypothetical protein
MINAGMDSITIFRCAEEEFHIQLTAMAKSKGCQPGTFVHSIRYEYCTHVTLNHSLT